MHCRNAELPEQGTPYMQLNPSLPHAWPASGATVGQAPPGGEAHCHVAFCMHGPLKHEPHEQMVPPPMSQF
jgi:hypothetical protein